MTLLRIQSRFLSLEKQLGGKRATQDILIISFVAIVTLTTAISANAPRSFYNWASNGLCPVDELITLILVIALASAVFAARRISELRLEIQRRDEAESQMQHMALHDSLTGLPNRLLLASRLEQELARAERDGTSVAVLCLDLDRFKQVNDIYGHPAGDRLLQTVADRLRASVRKMDTLTRLGGDEFAIVQPGLAQPDGAAGLSQRLLKVLSEPIRLHDGYTVVTASIGIAVSSGDNLDPHELLRSSDVALYRAKSAGRSRFQFFESAMDAQLRERMEIEAELHKALAKGHLLLHFQPQVNVDNGNIFGFEALLRWQHPRRGFIPPDHFIPVAEETGLILNIGEWVLREACLQAQHWPNDIKISVNLSPVQFQHRDLVATVKAALDLAKLDPKRLELEITETILMQDTESTLQTLAELKSMGINIAMDDFGTGYSSLSYLRRFPFDKIKIDKCFVLGLEENEDDVAIVRSVVDLGRNLGMRAIAEGVETEGQLARLKKEGCCEVQGYLYSRPVSANEATALLKRTPGSPANQE